MSDHRPGPGWGRGADGPRAVAAVLATLPASFHFLHGLPVGRQRDVVDHLVVGPTGAWVISSERWSGAVTATTDGMLWREQGPITADIDRLQALAAYARRSLGVEVQATLCVVGATLPHPSQRIGGVEVIHLDALVPIITSQPVTLDGPAIDEVMSAAAAWRVQPPDHHRPAARPARPAATATAARPAPVGAGTAALPTPFRVTSGHVMAAATFVAVSMIVLIAYLLARDEPAMGATGIDPVRVAAQSVGGIDEAFTVRLSCSPDTGYSMSGEAGALGTARIRVAAAVAGGDPRYLGELAAFEGAPAISGLPRDTTVEFETQWVEPDGSGGETKTTKVTTFDAGC